MTRALRILRRVLYWLDVLAVSLVLVFLLIMLFESRDDSDIEEGGANSALRSPVAQTR